MPSKCWVFLWGRKMPLPNILEFIGTNISQRKFQEAQEKLLNYLGFEVPTKTELAVKADKTYVDTALTGFTNGASKFYATLAAANADIANIGIKDKVEVGETTNGGTWYKATAGATSLTKSPYDPALQAQKYTYQLESNIFSARSRNLLDKTRIVAGEYFSSGSNKIVNSSLWKRSGFIPVEAGKAYTLSGNFVGGPIAWYANNDELSNPISVTSAMTGTAPAGANFAIVNITNNGSNDFDNTVQFEIGSAATEYEDYAEYIDINNVKNAVNSEQVFEKFYKNILNPLVVNYANRYSTGSKNFVADSVGIAASGYIPVVEGEWYVCSGGGLYGGAPGVGQGGFFTSASATTAVANITFVAPVDNVGAAFQVPTGVGITHAVISLRKLNDLAAATSLHGPVQVEAGEKATAYQDYGYQLKIKPELLSQQNITPNPTGPLDDAAWYMYTKADGAQLYRDKLPNFRKHILLKDKDFVVVNTGTSLTARSTEHCTEHAKANERPPLMHSNNMASLLWDAMKWEGQKYRRYDYPSAFTETGSFITSSNLTEWDDGAYRAGLTRYSSASNAGVTFTIPIDAWQFNFIYRTDSLGCNAKVTVVEGPGKVQVFDEASQTWVEANNYEFSQLEAAPVTRTVAVPYPATGVTTNYTLASKGNTTYQKRLKMRCRSTDGSFDSRASAKTVTIARVSGGSRFMYWGVEWSHREHMITFINAARGSHCTYAIHAVGLPRFQDNEIWSFKPDLILSELGIHNDGASNADPAPVGYWAGLAKNYVTDTSYELSMYSRAAHFGLTPEYAFFTASITWNFGGIDDNGELKYALQPASVNGPAKMMNALDKYQEASEYLNSVGIPCIDAAKRWVDAGNAIFGDLKKATVASGKAGATFTNEGSHWNDTGSKIMAKAAIPLLG